MKKTVKILIAAVLTVGFGSLANAQSASISANATVISELSILNMANLAFGTVVSGQKKFIDSENTTEVSIGSALGASSRGRFIMWAQIGSNVTLTFTLPTNLSTSGGDLLPISFDDFNENPIIAVVDGDGIFGRVTPGTPYVINGFNSASEIDNINIYVGGQVDATGVTAGTYTGTITLSAAYN